MPPSCSVQDEPGVKQLQYNIQSSDKPIYTAVDSCRQKRWLDSRLTLKGRQQLLCILNVSLHGFKLRAVVVQHFCLLHVLVLNLHMTVTHLSIGADCTPLTYLLGFVQ